MKCITAMNVNENNCSFMTASNDSTIFLYKITNNKNILHFSPLYYIPTPNIIYSIVWKPSDVNLFTMKL